MYTRIRISNFRSFGVNPGGKPQDFQLAPLTIIVGDNSSGKSNIIRALSVATDPNCKGLKREDFFLRKTKNGVRKSPKIEIAVDIEIEHSNVHLETRISGSSPSSFTKEFYLDGTRIGESSISNPPTEDLVSRLKPYGLFVAPTVRDISYLSKAKDLLPVATRSTITGASSALRKELEQKLSQVTSKLNIATRFRGISARPTFNLDELMSIVGLQFEVNDIIDLPLDHLGHGDISKVIIKLAELQGNEHSIAIEEPEIHVHPTGIKSLVDAFEKLVQSSQRQVIVTTHSESLVNNTKFDSLVHVRQSGQRSIAKYIAADGIRSKSSEEHSIIRKSQRGVIFLSKMLVVVEGPDDRMLLEMLEDAGELELFKNDIAILELTGFGEFEKYRRVLASLEVPYIILMDETQIVKRRNNGSYTEGDALLRLNRSGELSDDRLAMFDPEKYMRSAPGTRRSMINTLSRKWNLPYCGFISHGHQDISGLVLEIFEALKEDDVNELSKRMFPDVFSHNQVNAIDRVRGKIEKKAEHLMRAVEEFPPRKFGRLTRYFTQEITRLHNIR